MDPHRVLGTSPASTEEEVTLAYRDLAKRLHPDVNPAAGPRMREVNAAYAELRRRGRFAAPAGSRPPGGGPPPGAWLAPGVRRLLGPELLIALNPQEPVLVVADAATWDAHVIRLVATDRRLLWLRDDAIVDRVRRLPYVAMEAVETRLGRRAARGELRVTPRGRRRLAFAEIPADRLQDLMLVLRPRVRATART